MFIKSTLTFLILLLSFLSFGQVEKARRITEVLCSDSLYGRGYVNNGVNKAANFLKAEFQKSGLQAYFKDESYFQTFSFPVNTFPGIVELKIDGKTLTPGEDFLVDESSGSFDGELNLVAVDTQVLSNHRLLDPMVEQVRSGLKNGFYVDLSGMSATETYKSVYQFNSLAALGAVVYATDQKFT